MENSTEMENRGRGGIGGRWWGCAERERGGGDACWGGGRVKKGDASEGKRQTRIKLVL